MSLKLFIVLPDFGLGGSQRVIAQLANAWLDEYASVTLLTLNAQVKDFFSLDARIQRVSLNLARSSNHPLSALYYNVKRVWAIRQVIKREQPDVVISFLYSTNVLTVLAARGLVRRVVISERGDPQKRESGLWDRLCRLCYRFADRVVVNNRGALELLRAYVPLNKLRYIPNPLSVLPGCGGARENRVLAVGRLHKEKGMDILLRAFAQFSERFADWHLDIVGDGPEREALHRVLQKYQLQDRVRLHGACAALDGFYQRARIFVLPSRHEGLPNALLEAIEHGVVVIASDASPGPLEYVLDGQSGLVVARENVTQLAQALVQLAENDSLRRRLSLAAKKRIIPHRVPSVLNLWQQTINPSSNYEK